MKKQQGFATGELISLIIMVTIILVLVAAIVGAVREPYTEKCIAGFTYIRDNVHGGITQVFGQNGPVPCR